MRYDLQVVILKIKYIIDYTILLMAYAAYIYSLHVKIFETYLHA